MKRPNARAGVPQRLFIRAAFLADGNARELLALSAAGAVQFLADLGELARGRFAQCQDVPHHGGGVVTEDPMQQVFQQQPFGLHLSDHRMINLRANGVVATNILFVMHDLDKLEHAVVSASADRAQNVKHVTHGCPTTAPENIKDLKLCIRRPI